MALVDKRESQVGFAGCSLIFQMAPSTKKIEYDIRPRQIPRGYVQVPFSMDKGGCISEHMLYGGFCGINQNETDFSVSPVMSLWVTNNVDPFAIK